VPIRSMGTEAVTQGLGSSDPGPFYLPNTHHITSIQTLPLTYTFLHTGVLVCKEAKRTLYDSRSAFLSEAGLAYILMR